MYDFALLHVYKFSKNPLYSYLCKTDVKNTGGCFIVSEALSGNEFLVNFEL